MEAKQKQNNESDSDSDFERTSKRSRLSPTFSDDATSTETDDTHSDTDSSQLVNDATKQKPRTDFAANRPRSTRGGGHSSSSDSSTEDDSQGRPPTPELHHDTRQPVTHRESNICMPDKEIRGISNDVGNDWQGLGTYLNYKYAQIERLRSNNISRVGEAIFMMIKKWHDVVVSCNENPRMLLAGAFSERGNNEMAERIVAKDKVKAACQMNAKEATVHKIEQISFDVGAQGTESEKYGNGRKVVKVTNVTCSHSQVNIGNHGQINNYRYPRNKSKKKRKKKQRQHSPKAVPTHDVCDTCERERYVSEYGKEDQATDDTNPRPGNFFYLGNFVHPGKIPRRPVFEEEVKVRVAKSVGIINGYGTTGTGFRVGPNYIMTAAHVVKNILDAGKKMEYRSVAEQHTPVSQFAALCNFRVYIDFGFLTNDKDDLTQRYLFQPRVLSWDEGDCDFAVLELKENSSGGTMPESLISFSDTKPNGMFYLIGHSKGERKHFSEVKGIIDLNREENQKDLADDQKWSKDLIKIDGYIGAENGHREIFKCDFETGASGSPGVVVLEDRRAVVVTMLVCGYPGWFYDTNVGHDFKKECTDNRRIDQGIKMSSIFKFMDRDPDLSDVKRKIFGNRDATLPE